MKKMVVIPWISLTIVLAVATPCFAHSLHPMFFGLGFLAPIIGVQSAVGWLALLIIVSLEALLLQRFIAGAGYLGSLWRAAITLVVSKAAETLPAFIDGNVFMGSCSDATVILIAVLMVGVGAGTWFVLITLLNWRNRPSMLKALWLSVTLECASSLALYFSNVAMLEAGFVK